MIKLIVSDMDGTLFNSSQEISPYNLAAIQEAARQGVHFMIATGRSMDTIKPTLERYNLKCGLLLMNGAEVRDEDLQIVSTIDIPNKMILPISDELGKMGYIPEYMTNQGAQICCTEEMMQKNMGWRMMCLDRSHTLNFEEAVEAGKTSIFQNMMTRNESLEEMLAKNLEIRKIIVFNPDTAFNTANRIKLQEQFPNLSILSSYPENIEINHKQAQKGYGLMKAVENMGILKNEVAVFGDGYNDISMFELFENSYAPVNAEPAIKAKAKEVIPSNNDDGVGKKINELLFHNKVIDNKNI
ncbi:MAG: Cof-type HAD-IIB family hydrolase [Lachnospiraceae bacterium]|nr:Cof-type HAD-IIB family hydrolase [Lachnospiraceae bacterium]